MKKKMKKDECINVMKINANEIYPNQMLTKYVNFLHMYFTTRIML